MAELSKFVCVDLGASGTRTVSRNGIVYEIPNNAAFVDSTEKVEVAIKRNEEDAHEDLMGALDVTITKLSGGMSSHFPCRVLLGDVAERYTPTCTRPSGLKNKADQQLTFVDAVVAAAHQVIVAGASNKINLYVALPPMEVNYNKDEVATQLKGEYKVQFGRIDKEVTINIENVTCVEEAFMALVIFFFNMDGTPTEAAKEYGDGYTLSLDIGDSTTDLAAAKNKRYVEKSGQTFKTGCNVIKAYMGNVIRGKYGFDPTNEELDEVISTGRLRMGRKFVELGDNLRKAKQEFARSIVEQLQSYFKLVNIPLAAIGAIVVSGGGSMQSEYIDENGNTVITCPPVSEFITKELHKVVDGIDVVAITSEPRRANIKGMFVKAFMDEIIAAKAAAASANQAQ